MLSQGEGERRGQCGNRSNRQIANSEPLSGLFSISITIHSVLHDHNRLCTQTTRVDCMGQVCAHGCAMPLVGKDQSSIDSGQVHIPHKIVKCNPRSRSIANYFVFAIWTPLFDVRVMSFG